MMQYDIKRLWIAWRRLEFALELVREKTNCVHTIRHAWYSSMMWNSPIKASLIQKIVIVSSLYFRFYIFFVISCYIIVPISVYTRTDPTYRYRYYNIYYWRILKEELIIALFRLLTATSHFVFSSLTVFFFYDTSRRLNSLRRVVNFVTLQSCAHYY